jgi:hypothetical protein
MSSFRPFWGISFSDVSRASSEDDEGSLARDSRRGEQSNGDLGLARGALLCILRIASLLFLIFSSCFFIFVQKVFLGRGRQRLLSLARL